MVGFVVFPTRGKGSATLGTQSQTSSELEHGTYHLKYATPPKTSQTQVKNNCTDKLQATITALMTGREVMGNAFVRLCL